MAFTAAEAATPETSFALFLQSELARRCSRNPMYSLRAFAQQLGVDASTLSQWLRNRRPLTARAIETIGRQLGLSEEGIRAYTDRAAREAPADGRAVFELSPDLGDLLGDWSHFAILELLHLEQFQPDTRWIARMLDLTPDEVNVALQQLIRLGLLEMRSATEWVDRAEDAAINLDALGVMALERLQKRLREVSLTAVRTVPVSVRDHSSTTIAVNSRMLPKAFELAARFRQQLLQLLQDGDSDDVYQIEVAIFPITSIKRQQQTDVRGDAQ
jgi:transcriptional regulator with XRE-family HTH domain